MRSNDSRINEFETFILKSPFPRGLVFFFGAEGGVEVVEVGDDFLGFEVLALLASFFDELAAQLGGADDLLELLRYLVGVVGGGVKGCIATGFGHGGGVGGDDRGVAAHGFEDGDAEAFEL